MMMRLAAGKMISICPVGNELKQQRFIKLTFNVAVAPLADTPATVHVGVLLSAPTLRSQHHFVEIPPVCHALLVRSSQCCATKQRNKRKTTLNSFQSRKATDRWPNISMTWQMALFLAHRKSKYLNIPCYIQCLI